MVAAGVEAVEVPATDVGMTDGVDGEADGGKVTGSLMVREKPEEMPEEQYCCWLEE
jgi:hypothetical protein